jgi:hypothetical protein
MNNKTLAMLAAAVLPLAPAFSAAQESLPADAKERIERMTQMVGTPVMLTAQTKDGQPANLMVLAKGNIINGKGDKKPLADFLQEAFASLVGDMNAADLNNPDMQSLVNALFKLTKPGVEKWIGGEVNADNVENLSLAAVGKLFIGKIGEQPAPAGP